MLAWVTPSSPLKAASDVVDRPADFNDKDAFGVDVDQRLDHANPAGVDDDDPLANRLDFGQDVRRQQDRVVFPQLGDQGQRFANLDRVEAGGRLVHDEDGRDRGSWRRPARRAGDSPWTGCRSAGGEPRGCGSDRGSIRAVWAGPCG